MSFHAPREKRFARTTLVLSISAICTSNVRRVLLKALSAQKHPMHGEQIGSPSAAHLRNRRIPAPDESAPFTSRPCIHAPHNLQASCANTSALPASARKSVCQNELHASGFQHPHLVYNAQNPPEPSACLAQSPFRTAIFRAEAAKDAL